MIITEYRHCSQYGNFFIPCQAIGEDEEGCQVIQYNDPLSGDLIEVVVDNNELRSANLEITNDYLNEVANQTATRFKTDLLVLDEEHLEGIANAVHDALSRYFGERRV